MGVLEPELAHSSEKAIVAQIDICASVAGNTAMGSPIPARLAGLSYHSSKRDVVTPKQAAAEAAAAEPGMPESPSWS